MHIYYKDPKNAKKPSAKLNDKTKFTIYTSARKYKLKAEDEI